MSEDDLDSAGAGGTSSTAAGGVLVNVTKHAFLPPHRGDIRELEDDIRPW